MAKDPAQTVIPHVFTVVELFSELEERLHLDWLAGRSGGDRQLNTDTPHKPASSLVGYLNFVHPNRIQLLGSAEMEYLHRLAPEAMRLAMENLFAMDIAAVVVGNGESVPEMMRQAAETVAIPLLTSPVASQELLQVISHVLTQRLAPSTVLHGVFLEVSGLGVLLTGDPAIGKSELALELISRGHRLVADDALEVFAVSPDTLEGRSPPVLEDFMEVRGLGVINIRRLFGESAVKYRKNIKLIIHLTQAEHWHEVDRLDMRATERVILGIPVPEVCIPVAVGRNLAVLVEVAVRNHILKLRGINPTEEFIERQRNAIAESTPEAKPS